MSQQNLVSVSITPEELKQISGAIDTLKTTLLPKLKVLNCTEMVITLQNPLTSSDLFKRLLEARAAESLG